MSKTGNGNGNGGGSSSAFQSLRLDDLSEYHPRPGFGTQGKKITVNANMYQARFKGNGATVYHYDVEINPVVKVANQKKPKPLLWKIWNQLVAETNGDLKKSLDAGAYDMLKNMYTPVALPGGDKKTEIIVALSEDGKDAADEKRRFKVVMQLANKVDLDTIVDFCKGNKQTEAAKEMMLTALQAMNVLFRQDATARFTNVGAQGRRFFGTAGAVPIPNGGVVYNGFMQSFRWTQSGLPAMQLDTAYSAFIRPGPLLDVVGELAGLSGGGGGFGDRGGRGGRGGPARSFDGGRGGRGGGRGGGFMGGGGGPVAVTELDRLQIVKLNKLLRMAKFKVTHRKSERVFTMKSLTMQSASELKFLLNGRDGAADKMVSIVDYYKQIYNVTVTKPRLPCVIYGGKNFVPMEFVRLEPFNSIPMVQLTGDQTAAMIKVAAKPPPERSRMISEWRSELHYEQLPKVKAWNVEVNTQMMRVDARVLNPPPVTYAGKQLQASYGAVRFCKPGRPLKSWAIVSFDRRTGPNEIMPFFGKFTQVLQQAGCPVDNKAPKIISQNPHEGGMFVGIKKGLSAACREAYMQTKADPQIIFCILEKKDLAFYTELKRIANDGLKSCVVTQCLQAAKINSDRGVEQYMGNVSMKVHAKLGGVTHMVPSSSLDKTTLMIGADVTHPPPKASMIPPSIAVSVASISGDHNLFWPSIRLQEGRKEIITDFVNMMKTHISMFERNMKNKPQKIIVFRDGVSEGQYSQVVEHELAQIRAAARELGGDNYRPTVTFVVCAKRHHMRFFATGQADMDKTGNLPAGTVVDRGVTHPFAFDFYLQAHAGLQGTARPTHYVVVHDDNKFTPDSIQTLCNNLCYSYARACRAVSIVPVAYYADVIAGKCRDFIYSEESEIAPSESSGGKKDTMEYDPLKLKKRIEDNPAFNSVAWYM